ncbi:lectin ESA-2 [Nostoc sp. CENA543]|uniref:lectin OAA family protein n=1 Tax=Nostoc sp. CENA543 TaxID=1869241 RepID=UPI000CA27C80|nr:lectin ESA-2 [Nostoc sp. CENA543]AUT01303.1 lectin ESA-2 [Nostoc sp. CENA543]
MTAQTLSPKTSKGYNNLYQVKNQWGGSSAPWNDGGIWVIGCRSGQNVVAIDVTSNDNGNTLTGTMTYKGEGPIGFKATRTQSNTYAVQNQWGGSSAPWNDGGVWVIGCRTNQNVVAIKVQSNDGGQTLTGTMTYAGEGPIGFTSSQIDGGVYNVGNQWGGSSAPWNDGGKWVIGCRANQGVVAINAQSNDGGKTLNGTMTYAGEGPIGFKAALTQSNTYAVQNQWGGSSAPWNPGGTWLLGCRADQRVVAIDVKSSDNGNTLNGTMTYAGEGPIGFKGTLV